MWNGECGRGREKEEGRRKKSFGEMPERGEFPENSVETGEMEGKTGEMTEETVGDWGGGNVEEGGGMME